MVKMDVVDAFLEIPPGSRNFEWCEVLRETIGNMNLNTRDMVQFGFFRGWRRMFKNLLRKKGLEFINVPKQHLHFWPSGMENGVLSPGPTKLILGNAHMIADEKTREIERLNKESIREDKQHCEERKRFNDKLEEIRQKMIDDQKDYNRRLFERRDTHGK